MKLKQLTWHNGDYLVDLQSRNLECKIEMRLCVFVWAEVESEKDMKIFKKKVKKLDGREKRGRKEVDEKYKEG